MVPQKLQSFIYNDVQSFCQFFKVKVKESSSVQRSILDSLTKTDKTVFHLIIKKLLHIYKISSNLRFMKTNFSSHEYIKDVLSIVQIIIKDEERVSDLKYGPPP